jgi:methionine-rich copper-binding protein CopC
MGGRLTRVGRGSATVLAVAVGVSVLAPAAPAAAHNSLTGSDPRNGARLATAPARIELRFLATPAPDTTKITVTGPDHVTAAGAPAFAGHRVSVPFVAGPAGVYTVAYRVGSTDGHPVTGEIRFTLTTGAPAATPSGAPTTSPPPPTPTTVPTPAASPAADHGRAGWWWGIGGLVALVALGGGLLLRRRAGRR